MVVETLKQTRNNTRISLPDIALAARTTVDQANKILSGLTDLSNLSGATLGPTGRFELALKTAQLVGFEYVARTLTWQEFEEFSQNCLAQAGFKTQKGVVFRDETRRWQIDIVATKPQMVLALDCKHWESPNHSSKFRTAIQHQGNALAALVDHLRKTGEMGTQERWALPIIVTLFEPRAAVLDGIVLVSINQLREFLERLTPYDPDLPFTSCSAQVESPIS